MFSVMDQALTDAISSSSTFPDNSRASNDVFQKFCIFQFQVKQSGRVYLSLSAPRLSSGTVYSSPREEFPCCSFSRPVIIASSCLEIVRDSSILHQLQ